MKSLDNFELYHTTLIDVTLLPRPLSCDGNTFNVPMSDIALITNGSIVHITSRSIWNQDSYCVQSSCEYGELQLTDAKLCISIPEVHMCYSDNTTCKNCTVPVSVLLGDISLEISLKSINSSVSCDESEYPVNITISNTGVDLAFHENELTLIHRPSPIQAVNYIQSPKFCLSHAEETFVATYCFPDHRKLHENICNGDVCVRKCCQAGYLYDMDIFSCVRGKEGDLWKPKFYSKTTHQVASAPKYKVVYGLPLCLDFFPLSPNNDPPDVIKLLTDGKLSVGDAISSTCSHTYCIDNFRAKEQIEEVAFSCFTETVAASSKCESFKGIVYPILLLVSSGFLFITIVVYASLPELHCKTQNKCLISSLSALLAAYLSLATVQLFSSKFSLPVCEIFGLIIQFSVLGSFFWLNVMSYDIWRTLRSMNPSTNRTASSRKRFLYYCLYGWGCPMIISTVTACMHYFVPHESGAIRPGFGTTDCFFLTTDSTVRWIYLYGFICVILIINVGFFIHLAFILRKAQTLSEKTLGRRNLQKKWAKLYLKLFLIMGISWLLEVASWVEGSCIVWVVADINNALRGFFIFVVFVCKKDVLHKVHKKGKLSFTQVTSSLHSSFLNRSSTKGSNRVNSDITPNSGSGEQTSFIANGNENSRV